MQVIRCDYNALLSAFLLFQDVIVTHYFWEWEVLYIA